MKTTSGICLYNTLHAGHKAGALRQRGKNPFGSHLTPTLPVTSATTLTLLNQSCLSSISKNISCKKLFNLSLVNLSVSMIRSLSSFKNEVPSNIPKK